MGTRPPPFYSFEVNQAYMFPTFNPCSINHTLIFPTFRSYGVSHEDMFITPRFIRDPEKQDRHFCVETE